ncbi:MAG: MoxR family ATPase [Victivallales bacterium]|nr:MoxR family ATPase [Victivallales bacterium]
MSNNSLSDRLDKACQLSEKLHAELAKVIVGQETVIDQLTAAVFAGGHVLLTGAPGLGKTLLVKSLARLFSLEFRRTQFTPDLMPADILGSEVMDEDKTTGQRSFRFLPGPVFTNILLADEINRTPPRTQSALLEAMGEGHVTIGGHTRQLAEPFFVLATQNPIELEGTYPLPEAQLDRFLLNLVMDYLPIEQEIKMVRETTSPEIPQLTPIMTAEEVLETRRLVREIPAPENVISYAVRLCAATRPSSPNATRQVQDLVKWGAGSRASQALVLAGKARALLQGRTNVSCEDVRALFHPVLRHRVITNFRAEADNISVLQILDNLLKEISE